MWEKRKLGDLVSEYGGLIQTGPFGTQLHEADYSEEGIPVVMPKDIIGGRIDEQSTAKVDEHVYRGLIRHALQIGDIVLPRRGNLSKHAIITKREEGWLCGTGCLKISISQEVVDPFFFYSYLDLPEIVEQLENLAVGSTMLNLSAGIIERFEIPLPPLPLQRQIAAVLGRYDALLENYQAQVAALEGLAQELYREWFVRGRCPGAQAGPNGELPAGWEVKKVADCFEITGGGTPSREEPYFWEEGTINWYTPTDITGGNSIFLAESSEKITEQGLNSSSARLFPAYSVMMTSRATIGAVAINTQAASANQGFIVCLPDEQFSFAFIYFWLIHNKATFETLANGATFLEISKGNFKKIDVIVPADEQLRAFDAVVLPIFKKIENLQEQITTLRATRDALLPRLLSGQLLPATIPIPA